MRDVASRLFVGALRLESEASGQDPLYYPDRESPDDFRALCRFAQEHRADIFVEPAEGLPGAYRLTLVNTHRPFIDKDGRFEGRAMLWPAALLEVTRK